MASATTLYTPEVLALATSLAGYPMTDDLVHRGQARSQSCGSAIEIGLALDAQGRISQLGLKAHACAVGQASAAIFAAGAIGLSRPDIVLAEAAIVAWLSDEAAMPGWQGLGAIAAAQSYPGRHAAILLAWRAALRALPST